MLTDVDDCAERKCLTLGCLIFRPNNFSAHKSIDSESVMLIALEKSEIGIIASIMTKYLPQPSICNKIGRALQAKQKMIRN